MTCVDTQSLGPNLCGAFVFHLLRFGIVCGRLFGLCNLVIWNLNILVSVSSAIQRWNWPVILLDLIGYFGIDYLEFWSSENWIVWIFGRHQSTIEFHLPIWIFSTTVRAELLSGKPDR